MVQIFWIRDGEFFKPRVAGVGNIKTLQNLIIRSKNVIGVASNDEVRPKYLSHFYNVSGGDNLDLIDFVSGAECMGVA